jgi:CRP/FNR family transcriptional regulator, cyclic AMP receptor protein
MSEYHVVKKDEFLFEEGDFPEHMYIVKSGQFSIFIKDGTIEKEISLAGPGNLIGEMSLFDKKFRSASARATVDSTVVRLPYQHLEKQLEELPEWVKITIKTLSEKLRNTNKKFL